MGDIKRSERRLCPANGRPLANALTRGSPTGLISPDGIGRVAVQIGRDNEGLRASGEVVARGCASVTDALTAVQWLLRQAQPSIGSSIGVKEVTVACT